MQQNELSLDAGVFKPVLETLLEKTANSLEREWHPMYRHVPNGCIIFFTRMRITINTYNTILWITADTPPNPLRKPLLFSVAPLVRTLFEELISTIFILHDVPNLLISLNMTAYTELWIERRAAQKYYDQIPKWQNYIQTLDVKLDNLAKELNLTSAQISNPIKEIGRFPTPGKTVDILKKRYTNSAAIPFMEFINTWMYRTLSGESHLNFKAIQRRGINLTPNVAKQMFGETEYKERLKENFIDYYKEMTWATFTLLLAIISEIEGHFGYQMKDKAKYLWTIFESHSDMAKDFYDLRYKQLLK